MKRCQEIAELESLHEVRSPNRFSAALETYLKPPPLAQPDRWIYDAYDVDEPMHTCSNKCVAQYIPPHCEVMDDYGCQVVWF